MTEKDLTKAAEWISAAAEAGYAPALDWIKDYFFDDDALIVEDNQIHSLSLLDSNKNEYVKDLLLKARNRYSRL